MPHCQQGWTRKQKRTKPGSRVYEVRPGSDNTRGPGLPGFTRGPRYIGDSDILASGVAGAWEYLACRGYPVYKAYPRIGQTRGLKYTRDPGAREWGDTRVAGVLRA